jgi:DivIVA domain-containing protein
LDGYPLDRIRDPRFSLALRGYDRAEVDELLAEIGEWIERAEEDPAGSERVRDELVRVGEQVSGILAEAHEAAREIREEATAQTRQSLIAANATAESVRGDADGYAQRSREEADAYARGVRADADAEVERLIEEAHQRKRDVEAVISDLEQRREAVVVELEQLASGITGTASRHRHGEDPEADEPDQEESRSAEPAAADPQ